MKHYARVSLQLFRPHSTEAAVCHAVYYINGCGRRPLSRWEPRVMWCSLTRHDVSPPAGLQALWWRLVLYRIACGSPKITSYDLFFFPLQEGRTARKCENTPEHNCLRDSCREKPTRCTLGKDKVVFEVRIWHKLSMLHAIKWGHWQW